MRFFSAIGLALAAATASSAHPTRNRFVPGADVYDASIVPAAIRSAENHLGEIPGKYMIKLKHGVPSTSFLAHQELIAAAQTEASAFHNLGAQAASDHGIRHVYNLDSHLQGYAGQFTDDVLAFIRTQPEVEYVERDSIVTTQEIRLEEHAAYLHHLGLDDADQHKHLTEKGAPWGLARISHREELGFSTFNKYIYDQVAGSGVTAYIIDTGVYINHNDFEGRARWGKTIPYGDGDIDGNGHGTHCAGTIGGKTYGVSKNAELVAVKVLSTSGSGTMSDVTAGVLWAVNDAKSISAKLASADSATRKKHKGFVANMSLGGGKSPTLDAAVNGAVASGVHFAVAAGNENSDACNVSPGGASLPVTVGASDVGDKRAYFSNKGKCVDIFAPGLNIKSTWNTGKDATALLSGTSMATPHTVGLLAYLLSIYGTDDFATIKDAQPVATFESLRAQNDVVSELNKLRSWAQALPLPAAAALEWIVGRLTSEVPTIQASVVSVLAPADLKKALVSFATKGVLTDVQGSPNALAFNNATLSSSY